MPIRTLITWIVNIIVLICIFLSAGCQPADIATDIVAITDAQLTQTEAMPSPMATSTHSPTPTTTPKIEFKEHLISKDIETASGLYIADIDGDGDSDIAFAEVFGNDFSWWRNDGGSPIIWTRQDIATDVGGFLYIYVADIDGDGDNDVVSTAFDELAWWKNLGGDPIRWRKHSIADDLVEPHAVSVFDLDGNGTLDILGTDAGDDKVLWWQNLNGNGLRWEMHVIGDSFEYTQTAEAADLDGDGDQDVIAGAGGGNLIAWWQNDGGNPIVWTRDVIQSGFRWAHWVHAADIDGDTRLDVLGAAYSDNAITWWRNEGGDPVTWERQDIDLKFAGALTAYASDIDGDGDLDVIGTATNSGKVNWWRNDGGVPISWEKQEIQSRILSEAWGLHFGDLDSDGEIDIVAGGASKIFWWENTLKEPPKATTLKAEDCRAMGLPELACTGITTNNQWDPLIREFDGIPMALVPAGCFTMGSTDKQIEYYMTLMDRRGVYKDEQPAHQQCFNEPFWIDMYEVTNGYYGSYGMEQENDQPRETITWLEADEYCRGRGAGLPTEAEWEYAARGPDSLLFPWGNEFDQSRLNYCDVNRSGIPGADLSYDDGYPFTAPVGSYPSGASWVGAQDMSGNLWEWVSSLRLPYPYDPNDGREVSAEQDDQSLRSVRGGGFNDPNYVVRTTNRNAREPTSYSGLYGLRCTRPFDSDLGGEYGSQSSPSLVKEPPIHAQLGDTWTRPYDGAVMVYVPEGTFDMGTGLIDRVDSISDEYPEHPVKLDNFWIDKYEVSNKQFAEFMFHQGNQIEGGVTWLELESEFCLIEETLSGVYSPKVGFADHPVIDVSWYGAQAYCEWVGGRLLTEAEWEYAASGPDNWIYPWGNEYDCTRGNFHDWTDEDSPTVYPDVGERGCDGIDFTSPVDAFPSGASWVGALDMAGNVWDWVSDWGPSFYPSGLQINPTGPDKGTEKMVRGGSWNNHQTGIRTTNRGTYRPLVRSQYIGFRCAYPVTP